MFKKKKDIKREIKRNGKNTKYFQKKLCSADDVYLTKSKIAVRQVRSDSNRVKSDKTKYFQKTPKRMFVLAKTIGRVRYGRG